MATLYVDKDTVANGILGSTPSIGSRRLVGPKRLSRVTQLDFEQQIREMSADAGLAFLYDLNEGNRNWRYVLSKYYRWAALQGAESGGETYYRALAQFIQKILTKKVSPSIFRPPSDEEDEFYLADFFPRRDPILHLETIFVLGKQILIEPTNFDPEIQIGEHIANVISSVTRRDVTRENILNIWSIAARLHEVGRVQSQFNPPKALIDETRVCRYLDEAIRLVKNDQAKRDFNHGMFTAAYLYYEFWKDIKGSALELDFAIALDAISKHDDYVRQILSCEPISSDAWKKDAMAIFLALMIICVELGVRIVWLDESKLPSLADWSAWQHVRPVIPSPRVELVIQTNSKLMTYHIDPQVNGVALSNHSPLPQSILEDLTKLFGSQFLAMTTSDITLQTKWNSLSMPALPEWYNDYRACILAVDEWRSKQKEYWKNEKWYIDLGSAIKSAFQTCNIAETFTSHSVENRLPEMRRNCILAAERILNLLPSHQKKSSGACAKLEVWVQKHR